MVSWRLFKISITCLSCFQLNGRTKRILVGESERGISIYGLINYKRPEQCSKILDKLYSVLYTKNVLFIFSVFTSHPRHSIKRNLQRDPQQPHSASLRSQRRIRSQPSLLTWCLGDPPVFDNRSAARGHHRPFLREALIEKISRPP